jgi:F0F1-type ATP synthase assembly protein I
MNLLDEQAKIKLKEIQKKLNGFEKQGSSNSANKKKSTAIKSNIAFDLIAYTIVALVIGYKVDNFLKTKPIFIIIFVLLAFITFFIKIYKFSKIL